MRRTLGFGIFVINLVIFISISLSFTYFLWLYFGKDYVFGPPVGGDYYNALTYLIYFTKHPTLPLSGWLPFWHEGIPVMGGYPFLSFYLTKPLTSYFDVFTSMNYFSFASLCLFFISALALFWQVSKNWMLSAGLVAILFTTKATYYQLTIGGNITAAATQWYLPAVLFFIFRYGESQKPRYLALASIFSGLSLLQHAPSSLVLIFVPSVIVLLLQPKNNRLVFRIKALIIFILVSALIGSMGLYTVFLQTFSGSGADKCISRECWGNYPTHLIRWLTPMSLIATGFCLILAILAKFFKKNSNYFFLIPPAAGFIFFLAYATAAYFKQIDVLANVLFPTRIFWAANLFLLLIGAAAFGLFQKSITIFSQFAAAIIILVIISVIIQKPPQIPKDFTATFPQFVENYAIPKFKSRPLAEVLPDWVLKFDNNWRLDINNSGLNQWFYLISEIPITTGYSSRPTGIHQDWQYFLQNSTRRIPPEIDNELIKNRALFLIDAFGIGLFEMSQASYPNSILDDKAIITKEPTEEDHFWRQISKDFSTPIVSPTNADPLLFIGSDSAYNYFIRSIAMTNLNSKILIPIKGPEDIHGIKKSDLKLFKSIFIYEIEDSLSELSKLDTYVKDGGRLFVDTASVKKSTNKIPEILPVNMLKSETLSSPEKNYQLHQPKLAKDTDGQNFAALVSKTGSWKVSTAQIDSLKIWAKPILSYQGKLVMAEGQLGKGYVVWSGLNLPFHIVENNNLEEAKLLKNSILELVDGNSSEPEFQVKREAPGKIKITGTNFKGIYFKENHDTGWQAKSDSKSLKIYKAGLDFMYVPITPISLTNLNVSLSYNGNFVGWSLFCLSIVAVVATIVFLISPKLTLLLLSKITIPFRSKLKKLSTKMLEDE